MYKKNVFFLLFTAFFFSASAQEFPIHITPEGYLIVQVKLNDQVPANFILDTGAGAIVLAPKTYEKIKEQVTEEGFFTGFRHDGDRIDGVLYRAPSIALGEMKKEDFSFGIYPPLDSYGIDGLLSLVFFEKQAFVIDFVNKKIKFINPEMAADLRSQSTNIPLQMTTKGEVSIDISIPICINNMLEVDAQFDTGNGFGGYILHPYFMKKLALNKADGKSANYQTPVEGKMLIDSIFNIASIGICNQTIKEENQPITFREGMIHEALIGSRLFRNKKILIDIPAKLISIFD